MLDEQPVETLYSLADAAPEPAQRRASDRHLSLLRVGSLILDNRRELCLIRNVSAGGMMIRIYSDIPPQTPVAIELKQDEPIAGTIRWVKDDLAGVTFDTPIDIISLITISAEGPRPRLPRVEVSCTAWVREDATVHRMKATNISQGGIMVIGEGELPVGAKVVVTLIDLPPTAGTVRWKDGDAHGIHFNRSLALPALVTWLRAQQQSLRAAS